MDAKEWLQEMWTEIRALQQQVCRHEIKSPENMKVLQTKLVLRRGSKQNTDVEKYQENLVVCGSEKNDNDNNCVFGL